MVFYISVSLHYFNFQTDYEDYGILGPPLYFEKSVYKAKVIDHTIELLDGPIILQNCYSYNFNVVAVAGNVPII